MEDRYLRQKECIDRLWGELKKYDHIYVAFDFDNTVFDFHNIGDTFPRMETLLRFLKRNEEFKLILFTCNGGDKLLECIEYCKNNGYEPDYVNENPVVNNAHYVVQKPYYSILLDDRAGLGEAYLTLLAALKGKIFTIEEEDKPLFEDQLLNY